MSGKVFGGRRVTREEVASIVQMISSAGLDDFCVKYEVCGSYRRERPDSGDIDIVLIPKNLDDFNKWYETLLWEKKIGKLAYYLMIDGVQVDLFIATQSNWGSMVLNYTGPPGFNQFVGYWCRSMGLNFTRSDIRDLSGNVLSDGLDEKDIFNLINMEFIEPKNRQTLLGAQT